MTFVDLEKEFDNLKRHKLFEVVRKRFLHYRGRKQIFNLYKKQVAIIRVENRGWKVKVRKEFRQGYSLSPLLFNMYIEEAIKQINETSKRGITIQRERINMTRFADDIVLLAENKKLLEKVLNNVDRLLKNVFDLKSIKVKRNSWKALETKIIIPYIKIVKAKVDEVVELTYL